MIRNLLAVVAACAFVYAWLAAFLIGWLDFGVAMAISAACVVAMEGIRYVERRRDEVRVGREQVWRREGRIHE